MNNSLWNMTNTTGLYGEGGAVAGIAVALVLFGAIAVAPYYGKPLFFVFSWFFLSQLSKYAPKRKYCPNKACFVGIFPHPQKFSSSPGKPRSSLIGR
jgi:hypothetical protein